LCSLCRPEQEQQAQPTKSSHTKELAAVPLQMQMLRSRSDLRILQVDAAGDAASCFERSLSAPALSLLDASRRRLAVLESQVRSSKTNVSDQILMHFFKHHMNLLYMRVHRRQQQQPPSKQQQTPTASRVSCSSTCKPSGTATAGGSKYHSHAHPPAALCRLRVIGGCLVLDEAGPPLNRSTFSLFAAGRQPLAWATCSRRTHAWWQPTSRASKGEPPSSGA
jgi:hypothetical protein